MRGFLNKVFGGAALLIVSVTGFSGIEDSLKFVMADLVLLEKLDLNILDRDDELGVGVSIIDDNSEYYLSALSHASGKCGGFELLAPTFASQNGAAKLQSIQNPTAQFNFKQHFAQLRKMNLRNKLYQQRKLIQFSPNELTLKKSSAKDEILAAVDLVEETNIREHIEFLSAFENRFHRSSAPNKHIDPFIERIEEIIEESEVDFPVAVESLSHKNTRQNSVKVTIQGKDRPHEIVVMGGHLDSIAQFGFDPRAPGADDNASGSSNLLEALRILLLQGQPERSIEIFWYAGEEGGLIGSAEIARDYADNKRDVIAVLQLDMTLNPGSGEFVLGSMTDFTSAWLRDELIQLNKLYIKAKIKESQCGYGCSDHASWHRQGFPALMPFEATFDKTNPLIHTRRDKINDNSSLAHSAMFSKIAVAFAMELANTDKRSL